MALDALVIAPHPDDAELGMAGAILKFKADGMSVGILDLTSGEPTPYGTPEIRARETAAARSSRSTPFSGTRRRLAEPMTNARPGSRAGGGANRSGSTPNWGMTRCGPR